jgi:hypothetical protein
MILSLPVKPRANRIADITASVPELTNRNFSMNGLRLKISSASSFSNLVGAPNDEPFCNVETIFSYTFGWLCPKMSGPQLQQKSMNSLSSSSQMRQPSPRLMNNGDPSTDLNARTGELTPPGK